MLEAGFYSIITHDVLYDKNLTANEKLLFATITGLTKQKGYCYASNDYLSEKLNTSKRSVSRWLNKLEEKRYIKRVLIYGDDNKEVKERQIYTTFNGDDRFDKGSRQRCQDPHDTDGNTPHDTDGVENSELINSELNSEVNKGDSDKQLKKRFENLWKLYPEKKGSKKTAFNSYKKAIKDGTTDQEIKDGISNYKNHLGKNSWLKAAYGSTWFNQERWKDEYEKTSNERNWEEWDFLG